LLKAIEEASGIEFIQAMILLIDNYDSFTYNLSRYLIRLGVSVRVLRNDCAEIESAAQDCQAIIISPGPCGPEQAGKSISVVRQFSGRVPILGVCLGHQVIAYAFGGRIIRARQPIHGKAFPIQMDQSPLFTGIPQFSCFARYHSLVVDRRDFPDGLQIIAVSVDNPENREPLTSSESAAEISAEIMAIAHRQHPTYGVQFHPESILSTAGYQLLANFLRISGIAPAERLPNSDLDEKKGVRSL
jgi:anthranilate synthase/aminodeoxychorismate synthase-like glutamine amidotransferase